MRSVKETLSHAHVVLLIYMVQTGIVVFSLPQLEASFFGTNGWLSVPIGSAAVTLNILMIGLVYRLGQGRSIFEIMESVISRWLLLPLYAGLLGIWAMLSCLVVKEYVLIFQMIAFPTTNPMMFKAVVDLLILYLVTKGLYNIGKAASAFFWLIIWMLLLLLFFLGDFDWSRMTPFMLEGGKQWARGFVNIMMAFLGYELCLLLFPYSDKKTKVVRATFVGNGLLTVSYTLLSIISFGFFSVEQLRAMLFPLLDLMAFIVFPFVERLENFFYGVFLFSIILTAAMFLWAATEVGKRIVPGVKTKVIASLLLIPMYGISYIPDSLSDVQAWLQVIGALELGVAFGLPMFLLLLLMLTRGKERSGS